MSDDLLLSLLWAVPLAGSILMLLVPKRAEAAAKPAALAVTLITFALALYAWRGYLDLGGSSGAAPSLAARAAAKKVSRGNALWTFTKSTSRDTSESTARRASSGECTSMCAIGDAWPSRYGPAATMRGPTSAPLAISLRHR